MNDDEVTQQGNPGAVARTHIGRRNNNEDQALVDSARSLYVVADGVGGHQAGEVASRITCDVLIERVAAGDDLTAAIVAADKAIRKGVETGEGREGMASTVVAAQRLNGQLKIAWVGDSRAYLWDGTRLSLLTEDHSLVATLVARGEISWEEAASHPHRNVILQALGQEQDQPLEVSVCDYPEDSLGGFLLLCSDGLSDVLTPAELASLLGEIDANGIEDVADELIDGAFEGGGRDNISLVIVDLGPMSDSPQPVANSVVWSYDPATAEFHGLPPSPTPVEDGGDVTRILPRSAQPQGTPSAVPATHERRLRLHRALIVILTTALIVAAVFATGTGN